MNTTTSTVRYRTISTNFPEWAAYKKWPPLVLGVKPLNRAHFAWCNWHHMIQCDRLNLSNIHSTHKYRWSSITMWWVYILRCLHAYTHIYRIVQKCLGTFTVYRWAFGILAHYLLSSTTFNAFKVHPNYIRVCTTYVHMDLSYKFNYITYLLHKSRKDFQFAKNWLTSRIILGFCWQLNEQGF